MKKPRLTPKQKREFAKLNDPRLCPHKCLWIRTEPDGCYWVDCLQCSHSGPAKHSRILAVLAFLVNEVNRHPRTLRAARAKK